MLHALREETPVVVVSKDTDVFVLLVYACAKYKPRFPWFMKIDSDRYVEIQKELNNVGEEFCLFCLKLPHIHCLTGCDTTSYPFGVGKVKVLKKVMGDKDTLRLLEGLGCSETVGEDLENSIEKFVQLICYSGMKDESYIETRVRLYKKMKVKSSMGLPADPKSLRQHIRRANFQLMEWLQCSKELMLDKNLTNSGWKVESSDESEISVVPVWYEGKQIET